MRRLTLALAGATALTFASAANATLTITGTQGTTAGSSLIVGAPDNSTIPNKVQFDTHTDTGMTVTSFFEFIESFTSVGSFSITTSTPGGVLTLEQLLPGGGGVALKSVSGPSFALLLTSDPLTAGVTYRLSYTGTLPAGGGDISGNASFVPVPEPATWAMMLLGFAGIGVAMRRRYRPALAQVA